jgi:hypothetical protein
VTYTRTLKQNDNTTGFGIQIEQSVRSRRRLFAVLGFPGAIPSARNAIVNLPWKISASTSFLYRSGQLRGTPRCRARPYGKPGTNRLKPHGAPITISGGRSARPWEVPHGRCAHREPASVWARASALRGLPLH